MYKIKDTVRRRVTTRGGDANYEKSNSIVEVDKKRFSPKYMSDVLKSSDDILSRQRKAQALVDHLSKLYKINSPRVTVTERPRRSSGNGQTYGFYRHRGGYPDTIVIYNTTAKTGKPVSIKSFADTLLHEFTHHYDTRYLKIDSIHSAGFYKRISSFKDHLTTATIASHQIMRDVTDKPLRQLLATDKSLGSVSG